MMDSFSPTFNRLFLGPVWPCEIEVSHMGKKPVLYRQRWEKKMFYILRAKAVVVFLIFYSPFNNSSVTLGQFVYVFIYLSHHTFVDLHAHVEALSIFKCYLVKFLLNQLAHGVVRASDRGLPGPRFEFRE